MAFTACGEFPSLIALRKFYLLLVKQIWEEIFVQKPQHFSIVDRNYPICCPLIVGH